MADRKDGRFKAKSVHTGECVYGSLIENELGTFIEECNGTRTRVRSDTVCRRTDIYDKNGTAIFEGDILQGHLDDFFPDEVTTVRVIWYIHGWYTTSKNHVPKNDNEVCRLEPYDGTVFEVVGNMIDNKAIWRKRK